MDTGLPDFLNVFDTTEPFYVPTGMHKAVLYRISSEICLWHIRDTWSTGVSFEGQPQWKEGTITSMGGESFSLYEFTEILPPNAFYGYVQTGCLVWCRY